MDPMTCVAEVQQISVLPASMGHLAGMEEFFSHTWCWCQYWRTAPKDYGNYTAAEFREQRIAEKSKAALRRQVESGTPPGMLAFLDGQLVGWLGLGPRPSLQRLVLSKKILSVDDLPVWVIVCFLVRPGYRRRGVTGALLRGAIEVARAHGAPAFEAYPVDPAGTRVDGTLAYVGFMHVFEREGFRRIGQTAAIAAGLPRWIVRLELS